MIRELMEIDELSAGTGSSDELTCSLDDEETYSLVATSKVFRVGPDFVPSFMVLCV